MTGVQTCALPICGLNEEQFHKLTLNGVAKIDYYTALSDAAAKAMRKGCKSDSNDSFTELKKDVKEAICTEVKRCLRQWGSAGRAAEVLERCAPWLTVEHLIVHNIDSYSDQPLNEVISEGKNILNKIPGVRNVFTGKAVQEKSKYHYCWLVQFTHKAALDNLHEHQNFSEFLKNRLSPNVIDLINIDFRESN